MPNAPKLHGAEQRKRRQQEYEQQRGTAAERGYDRRWQAYREAYLREHPLCVRCQTGGRAVVATVVDHIVPHKGDEELFWRPSNHQALCKTCHNAKTATEDGGFGR